MEIKEIPNRHGLKVSKMRMSCNDCGYQVPFPLQKSNFFYVISGNPGSGKTNLWLNLISRRKWAYNRQFHKVYIFSNSLHTIKKKLKLPDEQLIHGFSAESLEQVLEAEEARRKRAGRRRGAQPHPDDLRRCRDPNQKAYSADVEVDLQSAAHFWRGIGDDLDAEIQQGSP